LGTDKFHLHYGRTPKEKLTSIKMLIDKFKAKITIVIEKGICNENQFQLEFLSELEKFQASFLELF